MFFVSCSNGNARSAVSNGLEPLSHEKLSRYTTSDVAVLSLSVWDEWRDRQLLSAAEIRSRFLVGGGELRVYFLNYEQQEQWLRRLCVSVSAFSRAVATVSTQSVSVATG